MATLVLGTVGRVLGGPIGGLIGTVAGGLVDRSLFGGSRGGGRLANLEVQSAAYGEPISIIVGRMRVAGNLVWSNGIAESASGGGKSGSSGYSYSASFAVALAAGPIAGIGRIWADGTQICDSAGEFASPVTMRLYTGSEVQTVDPLIAATEGSAAAPAYRGIAYVVFEALPLADFGNRIPNLTFEIIASTAAIDMGDVVRRLADSEDGTVVDVGGRFTPITGHIAARAGSIADNLAPLLAISGAAVVNGAGLTIVGGTDVALDVPDGDLHARQPDGQNAQDRAMRQGGDLAINAIELGYYDPDRDYQAGLQRARRSGAGMLSTRPLSSAMTAATAKQLATAVLARSEAGRVQTSARLPWRHVGIRPGTQVRFSNDGQVWRVRKAQFEAFVVQLDLDRVDVAVAQARAADPGRVLSVASQPAGETQLRWLDLPALPGEVPIQPRLWLAASGSLPGWRRAALTISRDDGFSYQAAGTIEGGVVQGVAVTALAGGTAVAWDRFSTVDVELLAEAMWLQPVNETAALAGANLALIGDELIQFTRVEMLAPRRFRLSGLLRGRQGSEAAVVGHVAGEAFILLDRAALLPIDLPLESIGHSVVARANGSGDRDTAAVSVRIGGKALSPFAPAHLRLAFDGDDIVAVWQRRSRSGFGWPDFVDAPLAEASEAYHIEILLDDELVRTATVLSPTFAYAANDRMADGGGVVLELRVRQISALVGPGRPAVATLILS
jgi:hypothetical protein